MLSIEALGQRFRVQESASGLVSMHPKHCVHVFCVNPDKTDDANRRHHPTLNSGDLVLAPDSQERNAWYPATVSNVADDLCAVKFSSGVM